MKRVEATQLAEDQLARDRCIEKPILYRRKLERMSASAFAFLRGTAPLFYELLARRPDLAEGPSGEGWLVGDLHLENFGAYRAGVPNETKGVVFDVNDFDDAVRGPHRVDVLRLVTSTLLAARDAGASGPWALDCASALLDGYVGAMADGRGPVTPPPVARLLARAAARSRSDLLASRTIGRGGDRRFVRDERRYLDVPRPLAKRATKVFGAWAKDVATAGVGVEPFRVLDVAFRVAGTGSLGGLRLALLVHGKGGKDGAWIFELKQQGVPSAAPLVGAGSLEPAPRVVAGMQACLAKPPKLVGAVRLQGLSMLVRRLTPQEDKLSLADVARGEVLPLATYMGSLAAKAHRRGADVPPERAWKRKERDRLLAAAIEIAGVHEAAWLAYCRAARKDLPELPAR